MASNCHSVVSRALDVPGWEKHAYVVRHTRQADWDITMTTVGMEQDMYFQGRVSLPSLARSSGTM